jgi:hypothetical protein
LLVRARLVIVTRHRPSSVSAVHLRPSPCGGPGGRETDASEGAPRSWPWGWLRSPRRLLLPPVLRLVLVVVAVSSELVHASFACALAIACFGAPLYVAHFFPRGFSCWLATCCLPFLLLFSFFLTAITKNKLNCSLYSLHCSTPWVLMAPPLMGSSAAQVQPFLLVRLPCHLSRPVVVVWSASVVGFGRARLPSR